MPSTDWRTPADYVHAKTISTVGFAWEFLRRDPDYRRDFRRVKAHVTAGTQTCSLDAIEIDPASITFYEDSPAPGKRRLRAQIDQDGVEYDFSVPADAARTRFLAGGVAALEADARASQGVHVRLGLCRPFAAMPNSCYAQVNGLYFL